MAAKTSPNLGLLYGRPLGDGPWDGDFNLIVKTLDALLNPKVLSLSLTAPPSSPNQGDCYIVAPGGTGAWAGKDNYFAYYLGTTWIFFPPKEGVTVKLHGGGNYACDGTLWNLVASTTSGSSSSGSSLPTRATPVIRGVEHAGSQAYTLSVPFPTGTIVGDFAVLLMGNGNGFTNVSNNWVLSQNIPGNGWNGAVYYKTLDATDISNGSVTANLPGNFSNMGTVVVFEAGTASAIYQVNSFNNSSSTASFSSTMFSVFPNTVFLGMGTNRAGDSTNTATAGSTTTVTQLDTYSYNAGSLTVSEATDPNGLVTLNIIPTDRGSYDFIYALIAVIGPVTSSSSGSGSSGSGSGTTGPTGPAGVAGGAIGFQDVAPTATITCSSQYTPDGPLSNLVDGNDGTYAGTDNPVAGQWYEFTFTASTIIAAWRFVQEAVNNTFSTSTELQYYNGTTWVTVDTFNGSVADSGLRFIYTTPPAATQWRIYSVNGQSGGWRVDTVNLIQVTGAVANGINKLGTTTPYTLQLSDAPGGLSTNSASATSILIPDNSVVNFPVGVVIPISQRGTGQITISGADSNVSLESSASYTSRTQGSLIGVRQEDVNVWLVFGDLE